MGWRVALTDEADADLRSVVAFLAQKSPAAAERIGLELVKLVFSLAHRHYLVIYRVNETAFLVEILRIWDNRQDPARLHLR